MKLEYILPYLSHNLKCQYSDGGIVTIDPLLTMADFNKMKAPLEHCFGEGCCKPLLHPLSDLTKEIEHNGEKIIPIKELANICEGWEDEGDFDPADLTFTDYGNREDCYYAEWMDGLNQNQSFSIKDWDFNRIWIRDRKNLMGIEACVIPYQLKLFQKLFEWHFNVFNLPQGLWIDINSI